jgi:hypothetical protein
VIQRYYGNQGKLALFEKIHFRKIMWKQEG